MNKIFFYLLVFLCIFSCNIDNCSKNLGFNLDYYLFDNINVEGKSYCALVNDALNEDSKAILDLSEVKVGDGASYEHGAVLIEVINKIGEDRYLKIISVLSIEKQKEIYYSYISAGLDYTENPKYSGKSIKEAFPRLTQQLDNVSN